MLRFLTALSIALLPLSVSAEGKFFDSNDVRIHFNDHGAGEPVILVHGMFDNAVVWDTLGVTDALTDAGFRVIALDMRGYGESGKPHDPAKYGLEMSHDIARLLDHLNINKVHVVGYSQGSLVANRFRAKHPGRLLTAILSGGGALNQESVWVSRASEFADAVLKGDLGPMVRLHTPPGQQPPTQEQLDAMYQQISSQNDMQAVAATIRAQGFADSVDELRTNKVPTLALIGEADPTKKDVDAMVGVMSNLEVVVIPGADHGATLQDPMFLEETLKFLAKHR